MDDQPNSVKDLLVEAKDASELMVDLAYAAVFFEDEKLAREVERLEDRMIGHLRRLRMMAMLAARSPEDAEGMAGVLWIAGAVEKIGGAASEIARGVAARLGVPAGAQPADRDRDVGDGDPQRYRLALRPGSRGRLVRGRRPAGQRARGGRGAGARARGRAPARRAAARGATPAVRARPSRRHPRGAQGPVRGHGRPRILLDPVQQPGARGRGGRAGGS